MSSSATQQGMGVGPGWLYGRWVDILFGYGLAYLLSVPLLFGLGAWIDTDSSFLWFSGAVALATTTPHYGATLMRVYEGREERRKYALFAVWITAALLLLFFGALYDALLGSLLLTAYVSWSPWHFSGQNYGLAAMYLRRNGVELTPSIKRPLHLSFILSAVLAFLALHISEAGLNFAQDSTDPSQVFRMLQLGFPRAVAFGLSLGLLAVYVGSLLLFVSRLRPRPSLAMLAPIGALVATQALWFTIPAAFAALGGRDIQALLPFTAVALSAAHSTQYLWVSCYYARRERAARDALPFLGRCLLAGSALAFPTLLFAPGLLGSHVPNGAGILVLAFSVVNLHHFFLDGAIWKLRDGRVARALLRSEDAAAESQASTSASPGRHWLRPALVALGILMLLVKLQLIGLVGVTTPDADLALLQTTSRQLAFYGRDTPQLWNTLGGRLENDGQTDLAIDAYRHAMQQQAPAPWVANRLAWLLINHRANDPASLEEATRLAKYLTRQLGSTGAEGLQTLAAAHAAAGRHQRAVLAGQQAAAVARSNGEEERARYIDQQVAMYRAQASRSKGGPATLPPTSATEASTP